MVALPVEPIPNFVEGDTSITNLQNLAYAVQFWTDNDVRPTWHFYKTATASLTAATWNTVNFGSVAFDSDGVFSSGAALIVTPGIYTVAMCLQGEAGTSGIGMLVSFLATAGANNPNETSGTTRRFGGRGGEACTSGADFALCASSMTPWIMYPGDTIVCQIYPSVAITLDNNSNGAYNQGRYVCNYTGLLIQTP